MRKLAKAIEGLDERLIAGAALDVYEREPAIHPALLGHERVLFAPHIASATRETRDAMGERVLDNLRAFFAGGPMPSAALLP